MIIPTFERLLREAAPAGAEVEFEVWSPAPPGLVPPDAPAVQLGLDAFEEVLGVRPLLVRSGGAIPLVSELATRGVATILTGLRAQRVEHPLAQRADPGRVPSARHRDRRCAVPPPRRPWLASRSPRRSRPSWPTGVLERFLRYVRIDTQSEEGASTYPSTAKQLDLSRLLVDELREIGLDDVELNEHGYVFATLPGTAGAPVIGLIAHVDTTPESPGAGVSPIVHEDYAGEPIVLPGRPEPGARPGRGAELSRRGSGTTSSRATARRCSAPTTRPAWRRSWPPSRTSAARPSRARRCASRSRSTRRSGAAPTTSTSRRSAPRPPTRSTARESASSRSRRSRRAS